jgi:hypothetical protein
MILYSELDTPLGNSLEEVRDFLLDEDEEAVLEMNGHKYKADDVQLDGDRYRISFYQIG